MVEVSLFMNMSCCYQLILLNVSNVDHEDPQLIDRLIDLVATDTSVCIALKLEQVISVTIAFKMPPVVH